MSAILQPTTDAERPAALHVLLPTVVLNAAYLAGASGAQHRRIVVRADTVHIQGRCLLPGATVEIFARRIEFAPDSALDVSGAPVPGFAVDAHNATLDGTAQHLDGQQGAAGLRGNDGGNIRISVRQLAGTATLIANGAEGGRSQRGGDGFAHVNGEDAKRDALVLPGDYSVPPGAISSIIRVLIIGLDTYRRSGLAGHTQAWLRFGTLGRGGRGGAPGRPGDGGTSGRIVLRYETPPAAQPVQAAKGGSAGKPGEFGTQGAPGQDGKHLLVVNMGHGCEIHDIDLLLGGVLRGEIMDGLERIRAAAPGAAGADAEQASEGKTLPDARACTPTSIDDLAADCQMDYLRLIQSCAARDIALGHGSRGLARYQWLADLNRTATDDTRKDLHGQATKAMAALRPQHDDVPDAVPAKTG